jgi:hypothetical protein
MTLHFAYGQNMDRAGMARRCPGARPLGPAVLDGYRFFITTAGYASLAPAPGEVTHGVLWRLTARDRAALRLFENLDSGLYRGVVLPVRMGRRRMPALVYMGRERAQGRSRPGYIHTVIAAARDWDLPEDYLRSLARWSPAGWRGRHPAETGEIA